MDLVEKAAYMKGLADGLGVEPNSKEGKLWAALAGLLSDMARDIENLKRSNEDLASVLDEVSSDLTYLENLTGKMAASSSAAASAASAAPAVDCASCPGCSYSYDGDGPAADRDSDEDEDEDAGAGDGGGYGGVIYDVTCPTCGEELSFDEETLKEGSIRCPVCGELLEFDLDGVGGGEEKKDK